MGRYSPESVSIIIISSSVLGWNDRTEPAPAAGCAVGSSADGLVNGFTDDLAVGLADDWAGDWAGGLAEYFVGVLAVLAVACGAPKESYSIHTQYDTSNLPELDSSLPFLARAAENV